MASAEDKIQVMVETFMNSNEENDLSPLETLGILSFLTAVYHTETIKRLQEMSEAKPED